MSSTAQEITPAAPEAPVHSLPVQHGSFVGRHRELERVVAGLRESRLVTLTGLGGIGKTRLAVEAGRHVLTEVPDGVWWVDLSALRDPALVLPAAASALGLTEEARRPLRETLLEALRQRRLLLVLDNCEHLVPAPATLAAELLTACPEVRLMATSREPLAVPGEVVLAVPPLELPEGAPLEDLAETDAVRLFVERATAVRPGFRLDAANAGVVADICRSLDCIPLAIELAAARMKVLGPEEMAERLGDRFGLLLGANPRGPARQQTLRAVLDWSYELLEDAEQRVFDRLSAFSGGFTLEAAEHVCAGALVAEAEVLELLSRLIDKSLVFVTGVGGRTRYGRIETVRAYARERLSSLPEEAAVRRRHAGWFLELALSGRGAPDVGAWLDRMETEHDNFRSALAWAVEADSDLALRLVAALGPFWESRGHLTEGRQWAQDALAWAPEAPRVLRSAALEAAGSLACAQGDYPTARHLFEHCRDSRRAEADAAGLTRVLARLGQLARYEGRYAEAEKLLQEAVDGYRELGDQAGTAATLAELGHVAALRGERGTARFLYREVLGLYRSETDDAGTARTQLLLGHLAEVEGDLDEARRFDEGALAVYRRRGDRRGEARALTALANLARRNDDFDRARDLHHQALAIQEGMSDHRGRASSLSRLGFIAYMTADHAESERLFRECAALRRNLGDRRGLAVALVGLANAVFLRSDPPPDLPEARRLCQEALEIQREIGDPDNAAWTEYVLAEITRDLGELAASRAHAEASIDLYRRVGDDRNTNLAWYSLAELAHLEGDDERAAQLAAEALRRARQIGTGLQLVRCTESAARISCGRGQMASAALLLGAAEAARERLGLPPQIRQAEQAELARCLEGISAALDPDERDRCWETGRGLTLGEATSTALALMTGPTSEPAGAPPLDPPTPVPGVIQLLGGFSVEWGGRRTVPPVGVAAQAVKALALRGTLHVEELAELLWPEAEPGAGRRRLHNVTSRIRKAFDGLVVRDGEMLHIADGVEIDAAAFEAAAGAALAAADTGAPGAEMLLEEAVTLYGGELLPADRFEAWTVRRREQLFQLALRLMHALADSAAARGDTAGAVSWLERVIEADPLDEQTYIEAARLLVERGWKARAAGLIRRARDVAAELDLPPSAELLRLESALRD